jgi:hypothetical protein
MRSHWAEVPGLFVRRMAPSHHNGLKLGRVRRHFVAPPQGWRKRATRFYPPQLHVPGLAGKGSMRPVHRGRSVAVHIRRLRTPVLCRLTEMHAKVPFPRCRSA